MHFTEGELKADGLSRLGLLTTCLPTQALGKIDLSACAGRIVYIHVDNDKPGEDQAARLAAALRALGCTVHFVRYPDCGHKGDVGDFLKRPDIGLEDVLARCEEATAAAPIAAVRREQPEQPEWPQLNRTGNPSSNSQKNIGAFLSWANVMFRTNDFTGRATVKRGDGEESELSDEWLRTLRLEADRLGLSTQKHFFDDVVLDSASQNRFHPVRDHLDTLHHDGKPRLDTWLSVYAGADDTPLLRAMGRKLLVATVRRVRQPGCKFDAVPVFEGPQGAGKSSLVRALGEPWYSDSLPIGAEPKIVIEQTAGAWVVEIPELTGLAKRDVESVKAMISRQVDRARPSYGTRAVDRPRQFTLWGTVNDYEYLQDTSGNRRFWPVRVGRVDVEALRRDRDQLWAEASAAEQAGESLELPPELWEAAAEQQAQRLVVDPWAAILVPLLEGRCGHVPVEEVNLKLDLPPRHQIPAAGRRITAILNGLGFKRSRQRHGRERVYVYSRIAEGEPIEWIKLAASPVYPTRETQLGTN